MWTCHLKKQLKTLCSNLLKASLAANYEHTTLQASHFLAAGAYRAEKSVTATVLFGRVPLSGFPSG